MSSSSSGHEGKPKWRFDLSDTTWLSRVPIVGKDVDLWLVNLDSEAGLTWPCTAFLAPDELERAARFLLQRDRSRYAIARATLRLLLAERLDCSPGEIEFRYNRFGKPSLARPAVGTKFNLSHSDERAVIAISPELEVGVDIESMLRKTNNAAVARRFFSASEIDALEHLPETERKLAFLACWTRKEAMVKAVGESLAVQIKAIEVTVTPHEPPQVLALPATMGSVEDWRLYTLDMGPEYYATLATRR